MALSADCLDGLAVLIATGGATVPLPAPGEPVDDEWRLHASAAADDKAPIAALLAALAALAALDALDALDALGGAEREIELVLCLEGEEESGSPHLGELMLAYSDELAASAWLICDGPVRQGNAPQVVLGVRGFTDLELTVYGPARELHSGHYGNWAPNPALALARLLASMKNDAGRVTIDGFAADTRMPTEAEQAALDAMPAVEDELLDRLGLADQHVRLQVYLHRLAARDEVVEWVRGTLLTDYRARMPAALFEEFLAAYRRRLLPLLEDSHPYRYPFKRLLLWGRLAPAPRPRPA